MQGLLNSAFFEACTKKLEIELRGNAYVYQSLKPPPRNWETQLRGNAYATEDFEAVKAFSTEKVGRCKTFRSVSVRYWYVRTEKLQ